jgi:ankyrin repeat protein
LCTAQSGRNALHVAVALGKADIVNVLLQRGVKWQQHDDLGVTPVHIAARRNDEQCLSLLLLAKADINLLDAVSRSLSLYITIHRYISFFNNVL